MKQKFLIILFTINFGNSYTQITPGFDKEEARDMIALCNSFTFIDLYNSDERILPPNYKKIYTSGVFGLDNKFQLYEGNNLIVINLRGSTADMNSWLENIYSSMIPANGVVKISEQTYNYSFARDTSAAVHAGYAIGILALSNDMIYHINSFNRQGIFDFIITGHSQGGSLANMLRAYLENLPESTISAKNRFKTYSFAAPMVGNKEFAEEYNTRYCANQTSYNIVNPEDIIPRFPLAYNENYVSENLQKLLDDPKTFDPKQMLFEGLMNRFGNVISRSVNSLGSSVSNQIQRDLGNVEMPPYKKEINYQKLGNRVEIPPVEFPLILRDSSILKNDSLMAINPRDSRGYFINKDLYIKEPWHYQHKPYNYYVSLLKVYFPSEYAGLKRKYLPENITR